MAELLLSKKFLGEQRAGGGQHRLVESAGASQPLVFAHTGVCTRARVDVQLAPCETCFLPWYTALGGCVSMCRWGTGLPTAPQGVLEQDRPGFSWGKKI